jgi:acyl-CoA synthetase (AMP-forming)/AMP-acid ligase II
MPVGTTNSNFASLLEIAAGRFADRPAVVSRDGTVTYQTLRDRAAEIRGELIHHGARVGDRVVILLERGPDAVAAYFGALATGCVVIVANERLRPRQIEHLLRDSGARFLLSSRDMLDVQHRSIDALEVTIDVNRLTSAPDFTIGPRAGDDVAQLIYTSGSTGLPRGVVFTHDALLAGVECVSTYLGLHGEDRIAALLPFSSVYGLNQLLCAIRVGAALVVERSPVASEIVAQLRAQGVTVLAAVPPLWLQLLAVPSFANEPLSSLRIVQNAGGHLPSDAVRAVRRAQPGARLFLQYGMTETFRSTFLDPDEVDARPGSIGKAVPGAEVLVLREDATECEPNEIGELAFQGPSMASGYWGNPGATALVFRDIDGWSPMTTRGRAVFSGDMVRRDADGFLYFVSRRDRMIKSLGFRIGPDEIVDVLFASGQIREAVVTTEPDRVRGERIVAFVVLSPGGAVETLRRFCGAELPRHMQPSRIEARDALPRLASGKYDLPALTASAAGAD